MQWWRSRRQIGSYVALFALCLQLALSFAHIHTEDFSSPAAGSSSSSARAGVEAGDPQQGHEGGVAHDDCVICASIFLAGTAVPASPPALATPVDFGAPPFEGVMSADIRLVRYVSFRTRAPPFA
jgi:hypothetical protein